MDRLSWKIASEKQNNGLWGTPMNCRSIDGFYPLNQRDEEKRSAIIIAISEAYQNDTFSISCSDENGFFATINNIGTRCIEYNDYALNGNVLEWIGKAATSDEKIHAVEKFQQSIRKSIIQ